MEPGACAQAPPEWQRSVRRNFGSVGTRRSGLGHGDSRRGSSSPIRWKGFGPEGSRQKDLGLEDNRQTGLGLDDKPVGRASARRQPRELRFQRSRDFGLGKLEGFGPPASSERRKPPIGHGFRPGFEKQSARPLDRRDFGLVTTGAIGGCESFLGEELRLRSGSCGVHAFAASSSGSRSNWCP